LTVRRAGLPSPGTPGEGIKAVHRGTYDAYGWIDEVENNGEGDDHVILMFHRDAWDRIVKLAGDIPAGESRDAAEFKAILEFAATTRRDVMVGIRYRSMQDSHSSAAYELLLQLMTDGMDRYRESIADRE
jgi:hypothetical protein